MKKIKNKTAKKFLKRQVSKLTVGETCKFCVIITVLTTILAAIPLGIIWICGKISDWAANRKKKEAERAY